MARLGCGACDIRADGVHTVRRLDDLDAVACLDIWLRRILPGEDNLLQLRHVDGIGVLRASCDARDLTGDAFENIVDRNGASCRFPGRGRIQGKKICQRIIACITSCRTCHRARTEGRAARGCRIGIVTDSDDIIACHLRRIAVCRPDDDGTVSAGKVTVVADDLRHLRNKNSIG